MEKGSLFLWVCLGVVGILSIFAMAFAGYTYTQTQQGGSINVRSINLGTRTITESGTTGSVIGSGSYSVEVNYFIPGVITQQTTSAVVGTYTLRSILDASGSFENLILEISSMSYTFTAAATASTVRFRFTNFNPELPFAGITATVPCTSYTLRQNNGSSDIVYNTILYSYGATKSLLEFFPISIASVTTGYTVSTLQNIRLVIGERAL